LIAGIVAERVKTPFLRRTCDCNRVIYTTQIQIPPTLRCCALG